MKYPPAMPDTEPPNEFLRVLRLIAMWCVMLALACFWVVVGVDSAAQTAPCTPHKPCVVERNTVKARNAVELEGLAADPGESLTERAEDRRYWLRCWQKPAMLRARLQLM